MDNSAGCFIHYYHGLLKKFEKKFGRSFRHRKPDDIHQLRVTIKKLKALVHLLESASHAPDVGIMNKSFEKIFKAAGKVRDSEVGLALLGQLEKEQQVTLGRHKRILSDKKKKALEEYRDFCEDVKVNVHPSKAKKIHRLFSSGISILGMKHYLVGQIKDLIQLMEEKNAGYRQLHELRKVLKEYVYNAGLINDCMLQNNVMSRHIEALREKGDQLGRLHDRVLMLGIIGKSREQKGFSFTELKKFRLISSRLERNLEKDVVSVKRDFPATIKKLETIRNSLTVIMREGHPSKTKRTSSVNKNK